MVLIGDADQLPSVGPGAVLSEMIASCYVPVVRLDKVYRQREGSRIAINAKLIRHGNLALEYGTDFEFLNSPQLPDSAETMVQLYLQEVRRYGVDNVVLLTPFRQKTETSVNALNTRLRDLLNGFASRSQVGVVRNDRIHCLAHHAEDEVTLRSTGVHFLFAHAERAPAA